MLGTAVLAAAVDAVLGVVAGGAVELVARVPSGAAGACARLGARGHVRTLVGVAAAWAAAAVVDGDRAAQQPVSRGGAHRAGGARGAAGVGRARSATRGGDGCARPPAISQDASCDVPARPTPMSDARLTVRLTPRASRDALVGRRDGILAEHAFRAAPVNGAANRPSAG